MVESADHAHGPDFAQRLPRERVGRVLRALTLDARRHAHLHTASAHAHAVGRHHVLLEAALAMALEAMEAPLVPRAHDVIAFERALSERTAGVIAGAVDRAKDPSTQESAMRVPWTWIC